MAKDNKTSAETPSVTEAVLTPSVPSEAEIPLNLAEFCASLSSSDKRVELIGGFHHYEKLNGKIKDTRSNYLARFEAFAKMPA